MAVNIAEVSNSYIETSCNLVVIWGKAEVNIARKQGSDCIGNAAHLHLQRKLH